jgi:hypothetical protein
MKIGSLKHEKVGQVTLFSPGERNWLAESRQLGLVLLDAVLGIAHFPE